MDLLNQEHLRNPGAAWGLVVSCARAEVKLLMGCSLPSALGLNTPCPKRGFLALLGSVTAHSHVSSLMPAGMPSDTFQKEQKPHPRCQLPQQAAIPVLSGIGNLGHLARTL